MQVSKFTVLSAYLGHGGRCSLYAVLVKITDLEYLNTVFFAVGLPLMGCLFSCPICHLHNCINHCFTPFFSFFLFTIKIY